jgi:hypothetical protein
MFSLARLLIHRQNYYLLTQKEELGDYLIDKDAELAGPINIIRLLNGMHVNILSFLTN